MTFKMGLDLKMTLVVYRITVQNCVLLPKKCTIKLLPCCTIMKNVQSMITLLGQNDNVITFDVAIYVTANGIKWRLRQEFESMVI